MRYLAIFSLVLLSKIAWGSCDAPDVIQTIRPGAQWTMQAGDVSTLVWLSTQTIPTKAEVVAAMSACQTNETSRKALKQQAKLDVKNAGLTIPQRLQALLILLDYDQ